MSVAKYKMFDQTPHIQGYLGNNTPELLVLHSTRAHPTFGELRDYHKSRGFATAGYHFFVDKGGMVHNCRPVDKEGAHALGFNFRSIGVCYAEEQEELEHGRASQIKSLIEKLVDTYDLQEVIPHTMAQVRFFNSLLPKNKVLKENKYICMPNLFSQYQDIVRHLGTSVMGDVRVAMELKKFKNCPGPSFYEVMG